MIIIFKNWNNISYFLVLRIPLFRSTFAQRFARNVTGTHGGGGGRQERGRMQIDQEQSAPIMIQARGQILIELICWARVRLVRRNDDAPGDARWRRQTAAAQIITAAKHGALYTGLPIVYPNLKLEGNRLSALKVTSSINGLITDIRLMG